MTPNEDCKVHCKVERVCIEIKEQRNRRGLCLDLTLIIVQTLSFRQNVYFIPKKQCSRFFE